MASNSRYLANLLGTDEQIQLNDLAFNVLDSADVTTIIDSDYIQARQVDVFRDSGFITNIVDSDYIAARTAAGTDSSTVITIITDTVDSDYIIARSAPGTDSATVIAIINATIDSDLIISTLGTSKPLFTYSYQADSGQTVFSGSDLNGNTLSYSPSEELLVYINGILLLDSTDYVSTSGASIVLNVPADSADTIVVAQLNLINALNIVSPIDLYVYTADSGQTIFSGLDDNGNTFSYNNENLLVYLNGVLLVDSADFNATSGTTVTLTSAAATDDVLSIATFNMSRGGLDSADVLSLIDSDYVQVRQTAAAEWIEQTGNYTANVNENIFVGTAGASITITLPPSPTLGDTVRIVDATGNAGTYNITINRNGNKIMGGDSDLLVDVDGAAFGLAYYNATRGWVFTEK
jgi:hypothetical protein